MRTLIRDGDGEPLIHWYWQDLRGKENEWGQRQPGFCTNGRAWLHWPGNCLGVQWALFSLRCGVGVEFSTTGDDAIIAMIKLPFVLALYFSLQSAPWVKWLPGVRYVSGDWRSGEREIRITVHDGAIWWSLWKTTMGSDGYDWRYNGFHFVDFLLGERCYSESERQRSEATLEMPEGDYQATVELFTASWKRPRWPWHAQAQRAEVVILGGVPIPGKGENSWDMEDDATESMTCVASTIEEALRSFSESIMRDRRRYASEAWEPDGGWPAHCYRGFPDA